MTASISQVRNASRLAGEIMIMIRDNWFDLIENCNRDNAYDINVIMMMMIIMHSPVAGAALSLLSSRRYFLVFSLVRGL